MRKLTVTTLGILSIVLLLTPSIQATSGMTQNAVRSNKLPNSMPTWNELSARPSPPGLVYASMAYDSADGYTILFGGNNGTGVSNQTWAYSAGSWTLLHPRVSPPSRSDAMMAYDSSHKKVVLYGGIDSSASYLGDTWTFAGGQWTPVNATIGAGPLADGAMTYDPQVGHVVLWGGDYYPSCGCVTYVNDKLYSYANGNWTALHSGNRSRFLPLIGPSIAYDQTDKYLLEFGGFIFTSHKSTTWSYSSHRWSELKGSPHPTWRNYSQLVFDSKLGFITLFGGINQNSPPGPNDTWEFLGGRWTQLHPSHAPPREVAPAAEVYDASDGYLVLFGGQNSTSSSPSNETWIFK